MEIVAYDIKGTKIENQYFPIAGSNLTGKEVYKYDDKGNISEMTLVNEDGSLMSKEIYKYEFDFAGNWNKMITSVAVIEGGKMSFEPTEVTHRSIMYYLDENMMKMAQPASPAPASSAVSNNAPVKAEDKNRRPFPKPRVPRIQRLAQLLVQCPREKWLRQIQMLLRNLQLYALLTRLQFVSIRSHLHPRHLAHY